MEIQMTIVNWWCFSSLSVRVSIYSLLRKYQQDKKLRTQQHFFLAWQLHTNTQMILTVRTHLVFSPADTIRSAQRKTSHSPGLSLRTVNKAVACQGLHCMSQWNMYIAVCHQWHGFYKGLHHVHRNVCFSDSIPLAVMGVGTRKGSSGGIIKPDINVFGVHLNTFHWTTHLLYFNNF